MHNRRPHLKLHFRIEQDQIPDPTAKPSLMNSSPDASLNSPSNSNNISDLNFTNLINSPNSELTSNSPQDISHQWDIAFFTNTLFCNFCQSKKKKKEISILNKTFEIYF